ncbi:UbiA family prenyltransferase, partial [Pontimicrobium sp. MEBiC01747]
MGKHLVNVFTLIRINQWIKNAFVFLPIFFDQQFTSFSALLDGGIAFLGFSLIASAIYCFNDYIDVDFDKNHPEKKHRPIASGAIKKQQAIVYMLLLLLSSILITYCFNGMKLTTVVLTYFVLNILYTLILKKIIIIDVITIASSFVLRIVAGGV